MGSLIKFELKKILSRRVMQISLGVILAFTCYIVVFNITSQYSLNPNTVNEEFEGTEAIAQMKANADALAGPITNEKATETLRAYKVFIDPEGEIIDKYRPDRATSGTPGPNVSEYWKFHATHYAYITLLTRPWMNGFEMPSTVAARINTSQTLDLYGQVRAKIASQLDDSQGVFSYSEAEKVFWMNKAENVTTPVVYGYAGGWKDFFDLAQFLIFALIAVVIACAGVFNVEYREKTDAVLLSTRYGKSRLGKAKIAAAFIVSSVIYWFFALFLLVVPLIFFGADGGDLQIQRWSLLNTYNMSLSGASLANCFIGYLAMLGLLGIVLALSARVRSSMGILALGVAIVILPVFISNLHNDIANHVLFLFPYLALDPTNLFGMVSYAIGPLVIEYPVVLTVFYVALFVGGSLLAIRSFNKHQVA